MTEYPETFQLALPIPFHKPVTNVSRPEHEQPPSSTNIHVSEFVESNAHKTTSSDTPHLLENPALGPSGNSISAASDSHTLETSASHHTVSSTEVLSLIFKKTATCVLGGIGVMMVGIGLAQAVILPRIQKCLFDTNCPLPFGVGVTNALTLLQTLMHYWLQVGMLIASVGLLKLSAYQAWFILMHNGNTIGNLDLNLGAIRGNLLDAAYLTFRKGSRWLSVYVLGQIGISTAIPLIIGLSIIRTDGTHTFIYSSTVQFPDSSVSHLGSADQLRANAEVVTWAVHNDTSHSNSSAYRGSLVAPDARNVATDLHAGGPRIMGELSCTGFSDYHVSSDGVLTLDVSGKQYIATPHMKLAQSMTSVGTAVATHVWVSNTTGILPNATQTSDGRMNMALCTHSVRFVNDTKYVEGVQEIHPSRPLTPGCLEIDPNVCVSAAVSMAIVNWWGGLGTSMWSVKCRGSVLGPLPPSDAPEEDNCLLTQELWSETVTSMLDGLMQVGHKNMDASQTLIVPGAAVDGRRWWFQALVPFLTLSLYGVGLCYTTVLSRGRNALKELTLTEIIEAAQTEYVRTLVDSGSLAKARVQYESETGFTIPNPLRPRKHRTEKGI